MSNTTGNDTRPDIAVREHAETKASTKTTEFIAYVAVVVAIIITALVVGDNGGDGGEGDPFGAEHAMRYITFLTIGYMVARGLAKSGSRHQEAGHTSN